MRYHLYRCDEWVYNIKKNRYYRCNNGIYRYLLDKKLCWCHYNKYVLNSTIILQKNYRGYKCRKYIKLYERLPDDLQIKIKREVSKEYYYKKYCNSIYILINRRYINLNNILNSNNNTNYNIFLNNISNIDFINIFNNNIYETYYLYNKYFEILIFTYNDNMLLDIKNLHIMSSKIITCIKNIAQNYFYNSEHSNIDNLLYNKLVNSIFIINSLSEKYELAFD